jgi:hypothetical protein
MTIGVGAIFVAELYLTPPSFFTSPFYYLGIGIFTVVGAFPYISTSPKVSRLTSTGIIIGGLTLVALSKTIPQTLEVAFGFPAIFIGIGLRVFSIRVRKK